MPGRVREQAVDREPAPIVCLRIMGPEGPAGQEERTACDGETLAQREALGALE